MATVKCPSCGAGILEEGGKFCSFCGALLPDDVHRAELKIENVSDMARLEFEREQARKQEEKEKKAKKAKLIRSIFSIILPVLMVIIGLLLMRGDGLGSVLALYLVVIGGFSALFAILALFFSLLGVNNQDKK